MTTLKIQEGDKVQYGNTLIGYVAKVLKDNEYNLIGPNRVWSQQKISGNRLRMVEKIKNETFAKGDQILVKNYVRMLDPSGNLVSKRQICIVHEVFNLCLEIMVGNKKTVVNIWDAIKIKSIPMTYTKELHDTIGVIICKDFNHGDIVKVGSKNPVFFRVTENNGMKIVSEIRLYDAIN